MMRPAAQAQQRGAVVGLHRGLLGADVVDHFAFLLGHHLGQRGAHDGLAGGLKARGHRVQIRFEQRRALETDDLAEIDGCDRRFVGNAEIEIAPALRRPVE
jgi:hypothetical protein